jgi:acyl carrier protein
VHVSRSMWGIDVEYINDDSDLGDDFGLDLLEAMELLILLEDKFLDGGLATEADEIEVVGHLIRHIEQHHSLMWTWAEPSTSRTA